MRCRPVGSAHRDLAPTGIRYTRPDPRQRPCLRVRSARGMATSAV